MREATFREMADWISALEANDARRLQPIVHMASGKTFACDRLGISGHRVTLHLADGERIRADVESVEAIEVPRVD
ncbi:hypothetical protein [Methylobacterium sp. PvR107]|jgi:hypothetical protein|uniref:hypothetical protein n=1 Tax=Methylobacterium sp. PvR107 TaxID=2806597 RepID=UPI001AE60582|nr:hypothetical protein [Methylobacterium sp. PvR107]MBP1180213.1 hypothetical protein [Methylobacterium sp. PvR107]